MKFDTAFEMSTSSVRFGPGVTREIGMDMVDIGARRVMVLTDPNLSKLPPVATVLEALERENVEFSLFTRVRVEPTDESFLEAIAFAREQPFDAFVAVGGGSTIDTAKAANLYSTYPADFLDYVNPPIGEGRPVPGPLKPLVAGPDHLRHRKRSHGRCHLRFGKDACQDRDCSPAIETDPWSGRPGQHSDPAPVGGGGHRTGCVESRRGVLHSLALRSTSRTRAAVVASCLSGFQSDQ